MNLNKINKFRCLFLSEFERIQKKSERECRMALGAQLKTDCLLVCVRIHAKTFSSLDVDRSSLQSLIANVVASHSQQNHPKFCGLFECHSFWLLALVCF